MEAASAEDILRMLEESPGAGRQHLMQLELEGKTALLCQALDQATSAHVRLVLCNLMASLADPAALPCLLPALSDPDDHVVAAACDAVGNCAYDQPMPERLRTDLVTRLLQLSGETSPLPVRTSAIYALGLMRAPQASAMLRAALDDQEPSIRWNAAEALAHIGDAGAIPALRARSQRETHERVQRILASALDALGGNDGGLPSIATDSR